MKWNPFSAARRQKNYNHCEEIYRAVQTMNISQTINFSVLLIAIELVNLVCLLSVDRAGKHIPPLCALILLFLLLMAANIFYCGRLLRLDKEAGSRRPLQYHTYIFTAVFALFCLVTNYISLQNRVSAESVLIFFIYIAAGPVYSLKEALTAVLAAASCSVPFFISRQAPAGVYSNLFLYCFISIFLSQMRYHILGDNLRQLWEARDEKMDLKKQADTDPLTGLLNRNGYSLRLQELMSRVIRLQTPVAVVMVDIDHFKQYNDTYGHLEGDNCLKKIAAALSSSIHHDNDLVCRFGGEEFQIFLYGVKSCDAIRVADRLRRSISALRIPSPEKSVSPFVTISVGAAGAVPASPEDYNSLSEAADRQLYHSKNHGKNMVSFQELNPARSSILSFGDKLANAKLIYEQSSCPFAVLRITETSGKAFSFSFAYVNKACSCLQGIPMDKIYEKSFPGTCLDENGRLKDVYFEIAMHGGRKSFYNYSPDMNMYLKIECFQFHKGYCGCILEDVTDQHYFELCGAQNFSILNQAMENGILITSFSRDTPQVVYMNTCLLRDLGYSDLAEYRTLTGGSRCFLDQVYAEDIESLQEILTVCSCEGRAQNCMIRIRGKRGLYLWFMLRGKLIIDEQRAPLVLFSACQITEQIQQIQTCHNIKVM